MGKFTPKKTTTPPVPPAGMFRPKEGIEDEATYERLKKAHDKRFAETSQEAATKGSKKAAAQREARANVVKKVASGATYGRIPIGQ